MDFSSVKGKVAIVTEAKLSSQSTIAALMDYEASRAIIEKFLPGFSDNQQAKAAYGMTFEQIAPMLGLPQEILDKMIAELDELEKKE